MKHITLYDYNVESNYQHKGLESGIQLLEFVLPYYHNHNIAYVYSRSWLKDHPDSLHLTKINMLKLI